MPTAVTGAPSGISLAGINIFDVAGIPPLSALMAPAPPTAEGSTETMEIPESKYDMQHHIQLFAKRGPETLHFGSEHDQEGL